MRAICGRLCLKNSLLRHRAQLWQNGLRLPPGSGGGVPGGSGGDLWKTGAERMGGRTGCILAAAHVAANAAMTLCFVRALQRLPSLQATVTSVSVNVSLTVCDSDQ